MNDMPAVIAGPTLTIFPPHRDRCRTVCVFGAARGGTSLVVGILRKLGVFMGEDAGDGSGDDLDFTAHRQREMFTAPERRSQSQGFLAHATGVVRDRDSTHDVWGWKDPLVSHYIAGLLPQLRNPVFILVTRDIGAIAQRVRLEEHSISRRPLLSHMKATAETYGSFADLLAQRARPTLLISYERALRGPVETGHAVADFLAIEAPGGFDGWLEGFVVADRTGGVSVTAASRPAFSRQFSATPAMRSLVEASLLCRHQGFVMPEITDQRQVAPVADALYQDAAAMLNSGEHAAAHDHALAIINLHVPQYPCLFDGPMGTIAEVAFGGGPEVVLPDIVCAAYYLLGMSNLLRTLGQRALICFTVAEHLMRRRLDLKRPGSILSAANYWSCVFHTGVAARAVARGDRVDQVRNRILAASGPNPPGEFAELGGDGLATARERALAEL